MSGRLNCSCVVGLVLSGYLLGALGFPIPANPSPKSAENFPCKNRRCGCRCADDCWRRCCCFTPAERLAWARAHHVAPPTDLVAEAEADADAPASCCCCCQPTAPEHSAESAPVEIVLGLLASKCRGEIPGISWLHGVPALPPQPFSAWSFAWVDAGWIDSDRPSLSVRTDPPDLPPPRVDR